METCNLDEVDIYSINPGLLFKELRGMPPGAERDRVEERYSRLASNTDVEGYQDILDTLDYFAMRLDEYSANNLLNGDKTVCNMLYEFNLLMPVDATKLHIPKDGGAKREPVGAVKELALEYLAKTFSAIAAREAGSLESS